MKARERVLAALMEGHTTLKDISHAAKLDESTAHKALKLLREEGLVERVGWGKYRLLNMPSIFSGPGLERPNLLSPPKFFFRTREKDK